MLINNKETLPDLLRLCDELGLLLSSKYVFRGQRQLDKPLSSSFERAIEGIERHKLGEIEQKIMLEFKRRAHHYLSNTPKDNSHLEWLALMQHYGCPTRLLDFTKSFYVGLFFAIDGAKSDAALWVVDTTYFRKPQPSISKEHLVSSYNENAKERVNNFLNHSAKEDDEANVILVEPFKMNERISIQQGTFLFPINLYKPFEENICTSLVGVKNFEDFEKPDTNKYALIKIIIPKQLHTKIAYWLSTMNITAATLFPGLEGFARSQITHIKYAKYGEQVLHELIRKAMKWNIHRKSRE